MSKYDITVDNVDEKVGPLTGDLATRILFARHSPLAGYGSALVSMFNQENISAWIGLAMIGREASYGVDFSTDKDNPAIDERNIANPFSIHFTQPKDWPDGCRKNALLRPDANGKYKAAIKIYKGKPIDCSAAGYRLSTFGESASLAIRVIKTKGLDHYSETPGYKESLNEILSSILTGQQNIIFRNK